MNIQENTKAVKVLLSMLVFFAVGNPCISQIKLTMQQAIDSTLKRNLQIKQARLYADISRENLAQSKYNRLPSLSIGPQASFNFGRTLDVSTYNYINQRVFLISGNASTQLSLFQGGLLRQQIIQNKLTLEADESNIAKVKNDLILETVSTFLEILAAQDLLKAAHEQVQLAVQNLDKIQKGFKAGNKSTADLAQAQALRASTESDESETNNQLDAALLKLKELTQFQSFDIQLIRPEATMQNYTTSLSNVADLLKKALTVSPDIQLNDARKAVAFQAITVARRSLYPIISLFGSMGTNYSDARSLLTGSQQVGLDTIGRVSGTQQPVVTPAVRTLLQKYPLARQLSDNFYQSAGVSIQIPVFNRFNSRTNVRRAKINYEIAEVTAQAAVSNFTAIFQRAIADAKTSEKRLLAAESNFQANKEIVYASEKRYLAGLLNSLDYHTAVTNYNTAEFSLIRARFNFILRVKIIDFYLGSPLTI